MSRLPLELSHSIYFIENEFRMKKILVLTILSFLIFAVFIIFAFVSRKTLEEKNFGEVKIGNNVFKVEIADTLTKQIRGLSGRSELVEKEGMLFIFNKPGNYGFWMKGMKFPLDIVWIRDNKIIGFEENLLPVPSLSRGQAKIYFPKEPVDRVLEVKAGTIKNFEIKNGDMVEVLLR